MIEAALGTVLLIALILALTLLVMGSRAIFLPSHPVTVTINENMQIVGTTGAKLLTILNNADIPVPSACAGAGTCGLCRVKIEHGGGEPLPTELACLNRQEISDGMRLACQIVVRNALWLEVPEDVLAAEGWECTVVSNTMLAPLIKELVLRPPEDQDFRFRAGSFVQVTAPAYALDYTDIKVDEAHEPTWEKLGWRTLKLKNSEPASRAYSIASTPWDDGQIVLTIRLAVPPPGAGASIPPGIVSSYLFGLKAGDSVTIAGPFGDFHAQESDREMIFIGGGVGMAPLKAMIFDQLERIGSRRKISYWYGARSRADLFYTDEFDQLTQKHDNFAWTVALSDPAVEDDWTGATGFIHDVVFQSYLKEHPAPEDCEYYLCGPPLMIQSVLAMLEDTGVESEMIFNDDFGS